MRNFLTRSSWDATARHRHKSNFKVEILAGLREIAQKSVGRLAGTLINLVNLKSGRKRFEVEIVEAHVGSMTGTFVNIRPPLILRSGARTWIRHSWSTHIDSYSVTFVALYREVTYETNGQD